MGENSTSYGILQGYLLPMIVCVKKKDMKEAWCLAVSDPEAKGAEIVNLYTRR